MFKKKRRLISFLALGLYSIHALSSPASTEYVKASIETLRNDLLTQIKQLPIRTHRIGEVFQGGIIFYIDSSGQHGLIAAIEDLGATLEWRNGEGGDRIVNAKAHGLGSGEMNTRLIIAEQTIDQQEGQFAALAAANYQTLTNGKSPCLAHSLCYGGWYLPSTDELLLIHQQLKQKGLGQFVDEYYWSSTEENATQAWLVDFSTGEPRLGEKSTVAHVRAIHAF
jgi:Protein of unknown function (DUF1566)